MKRPSQLDQLTDDPDKLKAMVRQLSDQVVKLEHNVEVYRRLAFGSKSEKQTSEDLSYGDGVQGHLFYEQLVAEAREAAARLGTEGTIEQKRETKPTPKKVGGRRKKFPSHAPVIRTTYEIPEADRVCDCGCALHEIGEDVRKELERIEISIVHEIACKKYACRSCGRGSKTAPGPDRVIEKGILGKGFLAHLIVERFQNHMPYYRLEKKYASEGLDLNRSVMQRSTARCAELLEPIWNQLREDVMSSPAIHTDDTTVTIAQDKSGKSRIGRAWIYLDLEGNHFYDCTEDRRADRPREILDGYKGFIHADACPVYDKNFGEGLATEVSCWAHVRRKFVESKSSDPTRSCEAVEKIARLYAVEKAAKEEELGTIARCDLRTKHSVPILDEIKAWLELTKLEVLPKSPMYAAIQYALNQWKALTVFTTNGLLAIDNNPAERAMRPFAVGRKNWLFFQQESGGRTAAILASLLQTAKAAGLNPLTYFRDVLGRIAHCSDVKKLTPRGWKDNFADEVAAQQSFAIRAIAAATSDR